MDANNTGIFFGGGVLRASKVRNSSIELLKVLAMALIILSHSVPKAGLSELAHSGVIDVSLATSDVQEFIAILCAYLGQIGNAIFIVCSAWFLLDSNRINLSKVTSIVLDCLLISVFMLGVFLCFGYRFPLKMIVRQFMPTILGTNWFITTYIIFYMIHPYLNRVINNLKQKEHFIVNITFAVFYCILAVIKDSLLYFNKLLGFIIIYFFVAYMKKYMENFMNSRKINLMILISNIVGLFALVLVTDIVGLMLPLFSDKVSLWCKFWNPLMIAIGISAFNLAKMKTYKNERINFLSSLSMLVLCFHCNPLVMLYFRFDFFEYIYRQFTFQHILLWILLFALFLAVTSILLSYIYKKSVAKTTKKWGEKISSKINVVCDTLFIYSHMLDKS